MEKRDLYNQDRKVTGKTIFKNEEIPEGYYILVVVVIIQNAEGKFLIQKRSKEKGGEWALTGGHPKAGESSIEGIKTEVKEELGIDIKDPILFKKASGKNMLCDLYYIKQEIDIEDIVMQKEEVEDVKYAIEEEIHELFKRGKFKKSHYMMFKDGIEYLNKKQSN